MPEKRLRVRERGPGKQRFFLHQLDVLQRQTPLPSRLGDVYRLPWVLLSRVWPNCPTGCPGRDGRLSPRCQRLSSLRVWCNHFSNERLCSNPVRVMPNDDMRDRLQ